MNYILIVSAFITLVSWLTHSLYGDYALRRLNPRGASWRDDEPAYHSWIMARAGWHAWGVDLLATGIVQLLIVFSTVVPHPRLVLQVFAGYFASYCLFFLLTMLISGAPARLYFRLGQWILMLLISCLLVWASFSYPVV
jgi:hypothetical protein